MNNEQKSKAFPTIMHAYYILKAWVNCIFETGSNLEATRQRSAIERDEMNLHCTSTLTGQPTLYDKIADSRTKSANVSQDLTFSGNFTNPFD